MRWSDGLSMQPVELRVQAQAILNSHSALTGMQRHLEAQNLASWEGDAADKGNEAHLTLVRSLQRQAEQLTPVASALESAATRFSDIQQAQFSTLEKAQRWNFSISDNGWVSSNAGLNLDVRRPVVRTQLATSVGSLIFRLNACDATLATRLWINDARGTVVGWGDAAMDGGRWLDGKIGDGLDWALDTTQDALTDVHDFFERRALAVGSAWERWSELGDNPPEWLTRWRKDGEAPYISQLGGYAITQVGMAVGLLGNAISGRDLQVFEDGTPYVGDVQKQAAGSYTGLNDVMRSMMDVYDRGDSDRNSITVTAVQGPDGTVRYVAAIPGTAEGTLGGPAWTGKPSGLDWAANFLHHGVGPTAATHAASQAIQDAIAADIAHRRANSLPLPDGPPELLLTGHSQGGIVAGQLLTDDEFLSGIDVKGIVSAGSPTESLAMRPDVPVYNFQTEYDPIPRTDGNGYRIDGTRDISGSVTNITLPHSGTGVMDYTPWYTHQQETYINDVAALQSAPNSTGAAVLDEINTSYENFFNGTTTTYSVEFGREVP